VCVHNALSGPAAYVSVTRTSSFHIQIGSKRTQTIPVSPRDRPASISNEFRGNSRVMAMIGAGNRRSICIFTSSGELIEQCHDVCFAGYPNHCGSVLSDPCANESRAEHTAREENRHVRCRVWLRLAMSTAIGPGRRSSRIRLVLSGIAPWRVAVLPAPADAAGRTGRASRTVFLFSLLAILFGLSASVRIYAQAAGATISGSIKDSSGSGISNASVSIKNTAGEEKSVTSREDGTYAVRNLRPGTYEVTVTAPGFTGASTTVTIATGGEQTADLTLMSTAAPGENVKQGTAAACCDTMSSKAVGELPLNGRSATDVAGLEPGVLKTRTQASSGQYGYGGQMAIFGGRPRQNSSRLDGISVNDYANGPLGNAMGVALGVDALEELSVLTRNDQAEYGRSSGGYISSSIRSGTSGFHGGVFEYFQNTVLNAKSFFDIERPPFHHNQYGSYAGGPMGRNSFFFGSYEGIRQSNGNTQVAAVPSEGARTGNLSTGTVVVDPTIARVLDAFYPLPNAGLLGAGDTGIRVSAGIQTTLGNHYVVRMDHEFSGNDSFYGIYTFDSGSNTGPDKLNNKLSVSNSRSQFVSFGETHTFSPHLLNSFKFGLYRMVTNTGKGLVSGNPLEADTSFGAVPGHAVPVINVPGLVRLFGGVDGLNQYHFHWTSIQVYDDISLNRGVHSLKFGVAFERMRDNVSAVTDPSGQFYFNSLSDFLTNKPFSLTVALPSALGERGFRQTVFAAYMQDNWLIRSNLTLNLGLRYEMATVPTEVHDHLTALRNLTDTHPHLGSPLFSNPTLRNFEPRAGIGWDPFRNGRALISSGFGIFDVLPLPYEIEMGELFSAPYFLAGNVSNLPPGSYPSGAFDIAAASTSGFGQAYFEPNPHRNYVMQYNFTTQWQLPKEFNVKVGYVGSRGVHHIFRVKDADIVLPTLTPQGYLWPSPPGSGTRLNPSAGRITAAFWEGDSYYNAFVLQVRKPIGRGSQVTGSFTWGKSIDTSSGSIEGDEYSNAITSPLWFNTRLNRGESDFDIAKDLKVIYSWQLPGPQWSSSFATGLVNGWQIGGIFEMSTGVPFTPGIGGDPLGVSSSDANIDVPDVLSDPGCDLLVNPVNFAHYIKTQCFAPPNPITLRGNLGRNRLIGPGLVSLDFSVFKNNYIKSISDTFNVQFRSEFFNIFNHPNILAPLYNRNIFDSKGNPVASAGLTDSTSTSSRTIQFALKFIW
jgi:hypothetical protein